MNPEGCCLTLVMSDSEKPTTSVNALLSFELQRHDDCAVQCQRLDTTREHMRLD